MTSLADIFKAYDIRGTVPDQLNTDQCWAIGAAMARFTGGPRLLLARDMRESGVALSQAFAEGARAEGVSFPSQRSRGVPGGRPPGPARPDVTVVIPARDRPAYLDRCLAALGQSCPVIVVDDGSRQAAEIAGLCHRYGATLIRRPASGGPGPARNDGLAQVTTPLVAFLDSDCETGPEWITSLAGHFADPLVAAVAPRVRPRTGASPAGRYLEARAPIDMGPQEGRVLPLTRLSYVPTAALLVRRAALVADGDRAIAGCGLSQSRKTRNPCSSS